MPLPPTLTTREGLRAAIEYDLREALAAKLRPIELADGDLWAGVRVVTKAELDEALGAIFDPPLPPTSETFAEIATPGTVLVQAACPRCFVVQDIDMTVGPELRVNADGSELRLRAKAKARAHVCGQLTTRDVTPLGQGTLDDVLEEGEGSEMLDAIADAVSPTMEVVVDGLPVTVETCDWLGCSKHHGHRGKHTAGATWSPDESGAGVECVGSNHVPGCRHFDTAPPEDPDGDLLPA